MKIARVHESAALSIALLLTKTCFASSVLCPPMPSAMTKLDNEFIKEIEHTAAEINKSVTPAKIKEITTAKATAVFSKFPKVDKMLTLQMMASTYCSMIQGSNFSDKEKLSRWDAFQARYLESVPRGPSAVPTKFPKNSDVSITNPLIENKSEVDYKKAIDKWHKGEVKSAFDDFLKLSSAGDSRAAYQLGRMYVTKSIDGGKNLAFQWFFRAANSGIPEAQHNLAVAYQDGYGVEKDEQLACLWFKQAAKQGLSESELALHGIQNC